MHARPVLMLLVLGYISACSRGTDATSDSREHDLVDGGRHPGDRPTLSVAVPTDSTLSLAGEEAAPRFAAGVYQLILVRDEPFFNDSLAARKAVDGGAPWASIDVAASWRDSARVVDQYLRSQAWYSGPPEALSEARTHSDSATAIRALLREWSCTEWRSAATLRLDSYGTFVVDEKFTSYCRGAIPAYSSRTVTGEPATLETCTAWDPPVVSQVAHLTCREGRWWNGMYGYRSIGDTLELGADCDGRETYLLRDPHGPELNVAWSSDVAKLDEC